MYIITFDLSLNSTGYAVFNNKKLVEMNYIDTSEVDELQHRLKLIADVSKKLKKRYKPEKIIIEKGFSRFNYVTQKLFRVVGIINYLFYDIEQIYIPSKTVRKLICGNGNIKKIDFFLYIKDKYKKVKFERDDEADAYALAQAYFIQEEEKNGGKKTKRSNR